jgi:hypothetical protein
MIANVVLFGCCVAIVRTIPVLAAQANTLVPAVVVNSLILALPVT